MTYPLFRFGLLACVAERLTPRTQDLEVRGSSLARCVVSLDKQPYSPLCLSSPLVCKWVPATYRWGGGEGGNPAMEFRPGGIPILLGMLRATETGISSGRVGLWLVCFFTFYLFFFFNLGYRQLHRSPNTQFSFTRFV